MSNDMVYHMIEGTLSVAHVTYEEAVAAACLEIGGKDE